MSIATITSTDLAPVEVLDATMVETSDFTTEQAREITTLIRRDVSAIARALDTAYRGRIWLALGHDSWRTYIDVELGGALQGLSDVVTRNEVIGTLADAGWSNRAIGAAVGLSDEPVRRARKLVRPGGPTGPSVGMDGKTYVRSAEAAQAVAAAKPMLAITARRKQTTALEDITAAGEHGITVPELMKKQRWTWSQASACLSRLNRASDEVGARVLERLAERRDGHAVYVIPTCVAGRQVLQPGQRIARSA
jgi:hypothetical protein